MLSLQLPDWLCYQFPEEQLKLWKANGKGLFGGKFRGQAQRWYIFRFTGQDSEVDLRGIGACTTPYARAPRLRRGPLTAARAAATGHAAEFVEWRWAELDDNIVQQVVPFKRQVYAEVLGECQRLSRL